MSAFLAGYYDLGLRALNAARLGLQIAGDNIANVSTPGYTRRRLELTSGYPTRVEGGYLPRGVEVQKIGRPTDRFLQISLQREKGAMAGAKEQLRGLREIERLFGSLEDGGIRAAFAEFSNRFAELAGNPESLTLRRAAITAADALTTRIRDTAGRLRAQQLAEDDSIAARVAEVNELAETLAGLNDEIVVLEGDGSVASTFRDRRDQVVENLVELTGGSAYQDGKGRVLFELTGGPTLVTSARAVPLTTSRDAAGLIRISSGDTDVTGRLRAGELGALVGLRDDQIAGRLSDLDTLTRGFIRAANRIHNRGTDLEGNPGGPLFESDPSTSGGEASGIVVAADVLADPRRLAVSGSGAPADGSLALDLANLPQSSLVILGSLSPDDFLADLLSSLGGEIVKSDVAASVAEGLVANYQARRESISGVSLDEEAVALIRHQQAFEAAARFMQVLNEVSEAMIGIGR